MPISSLDLANIERKLARARDPKAAAAKDEAAREKWAAGQEKALQEAIEQYAQLHGCYVVRPPMHKRSQFPKGYPDLSIHFAAKSVFIEAKTKGNTLSDDQRRCHEDMRRCGCMVTAVWNLPDAIEFIRLHLLP